MACIWCSIKLCLCIFLLQMVDGQFWQDASDVTWTRKVDTRLLLEDALRSRYTFLVGQITMGRVIGANKDSDPEPIMANAVATTDITFEEWIDCVIAARTGKGIKLRFGHHGAVVSSLQILASRRSKLEFPVWLHADLLDGPVNTSIPSVAADWFLSLCQRYVPEATLSLGWVTSFEMYRTPFFTGYTWRDVTKMADIIRCQNLTQPVSFSIRGVFVSESIPQLRWLTQVVNRSSVTVWSSIMDLVLVADLLLLRQHLPKSLVFYDLQSWTMDEFLRKRSSLEFLAPNRTLDDRNWISNFTLDRLMAADQEECHQLPKIYVTGDVIIINDVRGVTTLVFTNRYRLPIGVTGVISPFELRSRRYPPEPWITNSFSVFYLNSTGLQAFVSNASQLERSQVLAEAGKMMYWTIGDIPYSDCSVAIEFAVDGTDVFCNSSRSCFGNFSDGVSCQRGMYPRADEGVVIGVTVSGVRGFVFSGVNITGERLGARKIVESNLTLFFLSLIVVVCLNS